MTTQARGIIDDFSGAILYALLQSHRNDDMSLPRLCKALGHRASIVMRQLTLMGDVCGMGWVHVEQHQAAGDGRLDGRLDGRFMVRLTNEGLRVAQDMSLGPQTAKHDH